MLRTLNADYHSNFYDYEVKNRIAYSMCTYIFSVIEKKTDKKLAFIVYPNFFINNDVMYQELLARSFIKLPGIVNISNFFFAPKGNSIFLAKNSLILVSELMTNGNLETYLYEYLRSQGKNHKNMNPTIRSKIIFGVAATMKQIHQNDFLYEVLNMKNVFLDENFEPKLGDFVHGTFKRRIPLENTIKQSLPIYKAPEILIFGDDGYSFSSDVYSFAIFLYQMFSLSFQFPDKQFIRCFESRIKSGERLKKPNDIPDHYWDLIQSCWKNDQFERPTFEEITKILRDDKFAIEEFGMKTDLDKLHEYQNRIDICFPH